MVQTRKIQWFTSTAAKCPGVALARLRRRLSSLSPGQAILKAVNAAACGGLAWPDRPDHPATPADITRPQPGTSGPSPWVRDPVSSGLAPPAVSAAKRAIDRKKHHPENPKTDHPQNQIFPIKNVQAGGLVGGWSPNARADNIPALLTAGEFVQPVPTVRRYGLKVMEAFRRMSIPRQVVLQWLQRLPGLTGEMIGSLNPTETSNRGMVFQERPHLRTCLHRHYQRLAQGGLVEAVNSPFGPSRWETGTIISPYRQPSALTSVTGTGFASTPLADVPPEKPMNRSSVQLQMTDDRFAAQLERILEHTRKKRLQ